MVGEEHLEEMKELMDLMLGNMLNFMIIPRREEIEQEKNLLFTIIQKHMEDALEEDRDFIIVPMYWEVKQEKKQYFITIHIMQE